MKKLDTKDLQLIAALVAEARGFLLGREEGTVLMDKETINKLETICLGLELVGRTLVQSEGVFPIDAVKKAAHLKTHAMMAGIVIEDIILGAVAKNRDKIMEVIREEQAQSPEDVIEEVLSEIINDRNRSKQSPRS